MRKSFTQQQSKHSDHFNLFDSGLVLSSVELLPNASASAAFTVDSGHVFREDVDIVPITLSNGIQYVPWGADNQLPYHVLDLIESDETLSTCQIFNAEVCYGNGLQYNTESCSADVRSSVDDFLLCNNMATYFLGVCQDFKHFGWCMSVIILAKEVKHIVSLHRKEDYTIPYYASLFKGRWYNIKSHYSVADFCSINTDEEYCFQGSEADDVIKQIADIWNTSEITQSEAISQWISMHL